ncbi:metacaspase [Coprinopsis sp. MPI-PUGE-AT-0042]|nr:metacaspase [Coprinopsis sp. MPI-PUGE-AT-0042]
MVFGLFKNDSDDEREAPHRQEEEQEDEHEEGQDEHEEEHEEEQEEEQEEEKEEEQEEEQDWEYSKCNGRKKALLVGVNYFGTGGELSGCINDVQNVHQFLTSHWDYNEEDVRVLTDDQQDPQSQPTKENIIEAAQWLVEDAQPDDALFFHFSGHGTHVEDTHGDEHDGRDEAICPVDYEEAGVIVDDQLHELLVKPLPVGCRLTVIFDACHSGSALDLPYMYSTEGKIKEPNRLADAGKGLMSAVKSYNAGDMGGVFRSAQTCSKLPPIRIARRMNKRRLQGLAMRMCGCKDEQTSADTVEGGEATGAMSFALISVLTANPQVSYKQLLVEVRQILRDKYSQKPQLSSSHPIDTDLDFVC